MLWQSMIVLQSMHDVWSESELMVYHRCNARSAKFCDGRRVCQGLVRPVWAPLSAYQWYLVSWGIQTLLLAYDMAHQALSHSGSVAYA